MVCTLACLLVGCLSCSVFIAVGQQMGNVAFTDSMERLALAPSDTVDTIRKLITPGHKLVVDIASHTLVPTMEDINKTLTDAIDIPVLVGAAQCIIDRAVVPPALQELVDAVLHIVNLKDTIVEMDPDVQRIFDQVDNVTTAIGDNVPLLDVLLDVSDAVGGDMQAASFSRVRGGSRCRSWRLPKPT